MKKLKNILLLILVLLMTSCKSNKPIDVSDLIDNPGVSGINLSGTREVTEKKFGHSDSSDIKIGDKLYIDDGLVAIGNDYALPPKFSSKFVNLNDYLSYKGISLSDNDQSLDKSVEILNASQGQLFYKDFIVLSKYKLSFIQDDTLFFCEKKSEEIEQQIYNHYQNKSEKERKNTDHGEKTSDETSILLGVRQRIDNGNEKADYIYKTYFVRFPKSKYIYSKSFDGIIYPKENDFWLATSNMNLFTGQYDNIRSLPSNERIDKENSPYLFQNSQMNIRLNFVNDEYISFDYSLPLSEYSNIKYGILDSGNISKGNLVKIGDFTGEKNAEDIYKSIISREVKNNFGKVDTENIQYDFSNFGISHSQGSWVFQSSYWVNEDGTNQYKSFPLDIAFEDKKLNEDANDVSMDQVRNISPQAKDFYELKDKNYLVVNNPDELAIYEVNSGVISEDPIYSIPLAYPAQFIMLDQASGEKSKGWENFFKKYGGEEPFLEDNLD